MKVLMINCPYNAIYNNDYNNDYNNYYNQFSGRGPGLTKIPNSSSIKLILVLALCSPPSVINTRTLPPFSKYDRRALNYVDKERDTSVINAICTKGN